MGQSMIPMRKDFSRSIPWTNRIYQLDGQTCRISKKDTPGESDEEVDDATRHESDNLILVYILGNTMCITPEEQRLGQPVTLEK